MKKRAESFRQELEAEYQRLAEQNPDMAVYEWGMAQISLEDKPKVAEEHLHKALMIDSSFARAYRDLSFIEVSRGNLEASQEDLRRAVKENPQEPKYLREYADDVQRTEPEKSQSLLLESVKRFPQSEEAAAAWQDLARYASGQEEKVHYLEMLKSTFPPGKSEFADWGMVLLFDAYDKIAPESFFTSSGDEQSETEGRRMALTCELRRQHNNGAEIVAAGKSCCCPSNTE